MSNAMEAGLWPRNDQLDGVIPNIKAIFWQGSDWFNQLTNINKEIEAIKKLELVVCMDSTYHTFSDLGQTCCSPSLPILSATMWHCALARRALLHPPPKVIEPLGESKT